jgi:pyruvate, water dikinase
MVTNRLRRSARVWCVAWVIGGTACDAVPPRSAPLDSGTSPAEDAASPLDAAIPGDGAVWLDGAVSTDAAALLDGAVLLDSAVPLDGAVWLDGALPADASLSADAAIPADGASPGTPADSGAPTKEPDSLGELLGAEQFSQLSGPGAEVKYLTVVNGTPPPNGLSDGPCFFQNTRTFPYHLQFLRSFRELENLSAQSYEDWVLWRASRALFGGMLKLLPSVRHPLTEQLGVVAYTVYTASAPGEQLTLEELIELDERLKSCAPFARDWLVFLPQDAAQLRAAEQLAAELEEAHVAFVDPGRLDTGLSADAYSEGEAYGYLQLVTPKAALDAGPRDIVVVDAPPNDLGLVAGLVSNQPQSVASHLNLRLREKGIPNARAPEMFEAGILEQWQDLLVHLRVQEGEVSIEPAQLADAVAFWAAHTPITGELQSDLDVVDFTPTGELTHSDALAYGVKAANLGELHTVLPAKNRMDGFAIPFRAYADFVAQPQLKAAIDAALDDPQLRSNAAYKRDVLKALRRTLKDAPIPGTWEEQVHSAALEAFDSAGLTTRLRFRSSTNAEDLEGVSGAGLYDSASGCLADDLDADDIGPSACLSDAQREYYEQELQVRTQELEDFPERSYLEDVILDLEEELSEEKGAARALKKVWASLWNDRAFDDREYYALDHTQVMMGVAVHPALVGEQLEAVVVTNLEPASEQPLYRVVSQKGEVGVVRPFDPNAAPEILSFRRGADDTLTALSVAADSSLVPAGTRLWSAPALDELASLLFEVQTHFEARVYPDIEPLLLDIEVDVDADGAIRIKQARPYANLGEP